MNKSQVERRCLSCACAMHVLCMRCACAGMRCACALHVHVHVHVHVHTCACALLCMPCECAWAVHVLCMRCASTIVQPHIPRNRGVSKCQSTMWTTKTRATELFSAALTVKAASNHAYLPILGGLALYFQRCGQHANDRCVLLILLRRTHCTHNYNLVNA